MTLLATKQSYLPMRLLKPGKRRSYSWEQRKLGENTTAVSEQSPKDVHYTDNPSDRILVQGNADLKNHWIVPRAWTTEITKTVGPGDLTFSVRAPVGEVGGTTFPVVIGRGVAAIRGDDLLYSLLEHLGSTGYWTSVLARYTFKTIEGEDLRTAQTRIPSMPEQQIGSFFQHFDSFITLHQRKQYRRTISKGAFLR